MSSRRPLTLLLAVIGVGLVLAGVGIGKPPPQGIEGAYFTRESGTPAYSEVYSGSVSASLFSPSDGNLWIGAGIACCAIALGTLAVGRRRDGAPPGP